MCFVEGFVQFDETLSVRGVLGDGEWVKQNTGVAGRWIYLDVESEVIRIVGIG